LGYPRFTRFERNAIYIPKDLRSIFIGIILSDASLSRAGLKGDARLQFKQGYENFLYFYSVYFALSHYVAKLPSISKTTVKSRTHLGLTFTTRSLSCITNLYELFYVNKVKIIPDNLYELLDWKALAHWIMGDGSYTVGITLHTQCFSIQDNVKLINILIVKFGLDCSLHKNRDAHVIYIKRKSLVRNLDKLLPHMHESMLYKIYGGKKPKFTKLS